MDDEGQRAKELGKALIEWRNLYDDGWGDRGASGDDTEGGYGKLDHSAYQVEFRLLRAIDAQIKAQVIHATH